MRRFWRSFLVPVEAFVERPGIILIDKGKEACEEEQVDELGVEVVPLLDGRRAEDEQHHDDSAGDQGVAGEKAKEKEEADDQFCEGQGIGEGGDEGFG